MSDTTQSPNIELDEVMLAMDVVDTLRHQQSVVDRELGAEDHEAALIEKVLKIYAGQGIDVSDDVIAKGVKALREERFTYRPPQPTLQLALARLYVNRGRWAKRGGIVVAALLATYLVYHFTVVAPKQRARQRQQIALQELDAMPARLADQRDRVLAEAQEAPAQQQAQVLYKDAMTAVSRRDTAAANKAMAALDQLHEQLTQQYQIRIVSRQGIPSGVWRIPQNTPGMRNHYIIVEAVTADGKRLSLPITSEEDGQTSTVEQWGLRVDASVFEQVKRDKMDDGIIERNMFGVKKRGYTTPQFLIPTTGGAITRW